MELDESLAHRVDCIIVPTVWEVLKFVLVNLIPDGPKHEDAAMGNSCDVGLRTDPLILTTCRFDGDIVSTEDVRREVLRICFS